MTDNEKFEKIFKYISDNYKKELTDYKESKERGDVIRTAKASIRSEIFWEIILFINMIINMVLDETKEIKIAKKSSRYQIDTDNYRFFTNQFTEIDWKLHFVENVNNEKCILKDTYLISEINPSIKYMNK